MPIKTNKNVVDATLRAQIFERLNLEGFTRINDRTYGIILKDANGDERYIRVNAVVAEERENMAAHALMQSEISTYEQKQAEKAAKAAERAEKAKQDEKKRKEKQKANGN